MFCLLLSFCTPVGFPCAPVLISCCGEGLGLAVGWRGPSWRSGSGTPALCGGVAAPDDVTLPLVQLPYGGASSKCVSQM